MMLLNHQTCENLLEGLYIYSVFEVQDSDTVGVSCNTSKDKKRVRHRTAGQCLKLQVNTQCNCPTHTHLHIKEHTIFKQELLLGHGHVEQWLW